MHQPLDPAAVSHHLTAFFAQHLPITDYLGMRLKAFDGERFALAIDLQPSINDKLTAFGGSLFCACVMNCWGMVYLQARRRGINPNMVVTHAEIDYLAPVDDAEIIAECCQPEAMDWTEFFQRYAERGKTRATLNSSIHCRGKEAVRFTGQYAIIGEMDPAAD